MPLTAMVKETNEKILIIDFDNPKMQLRGKHLLCPFCGADMVVVAPAHKINHFRHHKALCVDPFDDPEYYGESIEHIMGKIKMAQKLVEMYPPSKGFRVEVEYVLPQINRRADIMLFFPNGNMRAYEIQLSNVPTQNLEDRTLDYESINCEVQWMLGLKALNEEKENWSLDRLGVVHRMYFEKKLKSSIVTSL